MFPRNPCFNWFLRKARQNPNPNTPASVIMTPCSVIIFTPHLRLPTDPLLDPLADCLYWLRLRLPANPLIGPPANPLPRTTTRGLPRDLRTNWTRGRRMARGWTRDRALGRTTARGLPRHSWNWRHPSSRFWPSSYFHPKATISALF